MLSSAAIRSFREASRAVVRELDLLRQGYGDTGASPQECHALLEIEGSPGVGAGELGRRLRLDKTAVSRILRGLRAKGWVRVSRDPGDARRRGLTLTARGQKAARRIHREADGRVETSLGALAPEEAQVVMRGMALYAGALGRSRVREGYAIRAIRRADDRALAAVIRTVMTDFDAVGPGYSVHDPEVSSMFEAYSRAGCAYFVLTHRRRVLGGAGIAPLAGGGPGVCELRKMYLLPAGRGLGMGELLLQRCLGAARELGYRSCYLETVKRMEKARRLYERFGFRPLCAPKGATGHYTCEAWYEMDLD